MSLSPARRARRSNPEKSRPSFFWFLAGVALPLSRLMMSIRIENGEKLPRFGPVIIAPNHYSEIDPVVIGLAAWKLGRAPRFLAKSSLFDVKVLGWMLRSSGQIPVERSGSTRNKDPIAAAARVAEREQVLVVYPEGTLTRDPAFWPMRGKTGAVRLALQHGIPIVPAAHWGTQRIMARYSKKISFFPPKKVRVRFGDAVDLTAFEGHPLDGATLAAATEVVMTAITRELEELRGERAPETRWDPSKRGQSETGRFES
ncbi:lysophospholipid acyltransferase family protein [Labedella populi]|uniref:lysophospholipid acyltransferase family protein n=1 Tax=Labedella populi TaxID=2498850 RepID=UPI001FB6F209|nr:lysophospholipid acyltransferase family protein [Labedella populi]